MRILIWGNSYPRVGGVETFITNLVGALRESGEEVAVVSDGTVALELTEPFLISMIPMTTPLKAAQPEGIMRATAALRNRIADFRPDIIHYNLCGPEIFFFERVMRRSTIPFVLTLHNSSYAVGDSLTGMIKRLIAKAFAVTGVSNAVCAGARRDLGGDVRLISNALPPRPRPVPYPSNSAIFALGRIVPEKGFDTLVEAFALTLAVRPEATLTIAGAGPELAALQAQAAVLDLGSAVSFPGWINPDSVPGAMEQAAVIAFPSRWEEPFGLVALEAAQAARPCVATHVGELPAIVRDGETGYIVPREDPKAMAAALLALLDDPQAAEQMGLRARQWAQSRFSFDAMVAAYRELFGQAFAARG